MKILIVEGNLDQLSLVTMLMDDWGYDFDIAPNGQRAVELVEANEGKYDVCLMGLDALVPESIKTTEIIRQKIKNLPILAVTGNSSISRDQYLEFGMNDVLKRPYYPSKLFTKINELRAAAR